MEGGYMILKNDDKSLFYVLVFLSFFFFNKNLGMFRFGKMFIIIKNEIDKNDFLMSINFGLCVINCYLVVYRVVIIIYCCK